MAKIDLMGETFGRLFVMKEIGKTKDRSIIWECQCDCGKIKPVSSRDLRKKRTQSCGCLKRESDNKQGLLRRLRPYENAFNRTFEAAKSRDLEHTISYEWYLEIVNMDCHYCGMSIPWVPFCYEAGKTSTPYYLDRKDNDKGYTVENCVPCCSRCNRGKMHLYSYDEWKEMGRLLRAIREGKDYAYIHEA